MNLLTILYLIIIKPIEIVLEVSFGFFSSITNNYGIVIVLLSLLINIITLPLYVKASKIQKKEIEKTNKLKKWEDHIKSHFKGDERFMILQMYYKQNDYKPYYSLIGLIPLLLQIPFFIAAYRFLSGLIILNNSRFGLINDLGKPDGLLSISSVSINILPILMTLINIISTYIYCKDMSAKEKIQMYLLPMIFLILLYNSQSALCLYWTLNNIFSLIKNIINVLLDKKKSSISQSGKSDKISSKMGIKYYNSILVFLLFSLFISCLIGLYIPSLVIGSSSEEFIDISNPGNPLIYIFNNVFVVFGYFGFWCGVVFLLSDNKIRHLLNVFLFVVSLSSVINFSIINDSNRLSKYLVYASTPKFSKVQIIQSIVILLAVVVLCYLISLKWIKVVIYPLSAGIILLMVLSGIKVNNINKIYHEKKTMLETYKDLPEIHLSKNGKNVVVIMMDRMISYYIPYIFNEKKEYKDVFSGFTYYPNCVSLGSSTNSGTPGLFGGYEYIPEEMNKRDNILLKDKQNEALKIMPYIFSDNGYSVTVSDPKYANYDWIPDLSIYDDNPSIKKCISMGRMNDDDISLLRDYKMKRNMFFYSIYKTAPVFLRNNIYEDGNYNEPYYMIGISYPINVNNHISCGVSDEFYSSYNVLDKMDDITNIEDNYSNNFMMISNDLTHSPLLLQEPAYMYSGYVNNTEYDNSNPIRTDEKGNALYFFIDTDDEIEYQKNYYRIMDYHVNMAAIMKLGEWLNYLKKEGVYDNTRIIIVSDHGADIDLDPNYEYRLYYDYKSPLSFDLNRFSSTLMVKDFNSTEFSVNDEFMTNADVPTIAMKELIDDPCNPFTGKAINSDRKKEGELKLMSTSVWSTLKNHGYKYMPEHWFSVHDNIYDSKNWSYLGYY